MPRLWGAGTALLAVLLGVTTAHADDATGALDRAKTAIDASDYIAARGALGDAIAAGTSGPDQLAEIYRLTGIVAGALGDAKAATDAFTRCLALTPKATLPAGTSPKIAKPFAAAQSYFKTNEPLKIKTETSTTPLSLTVIVTSDPLEMIQRVRATVVVDGKPEQTLERPGSERTTIQLPVGQRLDVRVAALDAKGNRLVELGSADVPIVIVGPKPKDAVVITPIVVKPVVKRTPPPQEQRPLYLRWWLHGGVAVAFGGAAAYFGIDAVRAKRELDDLNGRSSNHTFDEALAVEKRARRSVLLTNIGFGAAGAFAVTATILYLTRPSVDERPTERRIAVTPVVHAGGGGLVLGGHF